MKKLIFILVSFISIQASATTYTKTGYQYSWTNAAGWSPSYPGTTINAGDTVIIPSNSRININAGSTITLNGVLIIQQYGGVNTAMYMYGDGSMIVGTTGKIFCKNYIGMNNVSKLEVFGTIDIGNGYWETLYMEDSSELIIHPGGQVWAEDSIFNGYAGSTQTKITVNGTLANDGTLYNNGSIFGTGSITSINPGNGNIEGNGYIAPGLSPGELNLDFDFALPAQGHLNMELAGTTPGTTYDVLGGSGDKILGGTLNVILYNGYIPQSGDEFTIVTGGAVTGTFSTVNYPTVAGMTWQIFYNAINVKVKVVAMATGLSSLDLNQLTIYPNPVYDAFYVQGLSTGIHQYRILSLTGQQQGALLKNDDPIQLKFENTGVFFIEIIDPIGNRLLKPMMLIK
ncbi:MAG: hypothetical protein IPN14_11780 [Bacteroidetes bacterium]|nr:hypothetical protein [Bacteroidota bacterium]